MNQNAGRLIHNAIIIITWSEELSLVFGSLTLIWHLWSGLLTLSRDSILVFEFRVVFMNILQLFMALLLSFWSTFGNSLANFWKFFSLEEFLKISSLRERTFSVPKCNFWICLKWFLSLKPFFLLCYHFTIQRCISVHRQRLHLLFSRTWFIEISVSAGVKAIHCYSILNLSLAQSEKCKLHRPFI